MWWKRLLKSPLNRSILGPWHCGSWKPAPVQMSEVCQDGGTGKVASRNRRVDNIWLQRSFQLFLSPVRIKTLVINKPKVWLSKQHSRIILSQCKAIIPPQLINVYMVIAFYAMVEVRFKTVPWAKLARAAPKQLQQSYAKCLRIKTSLFQLQTLLQSFFGIHT